MSMNEDIVTYLTARRAGGFKLGDEELYLRSFARFATDRGDTHIVTQTAIAWAQQASTERQRGTRMKAVIRFARFSNALDRRHEIPPEGVFRSHFQRPAPYLFTQEQVQVLMKQALRLGPVGSLRPHTYSTLIGLLWVTGLRVSEALSLRFHDITEDGLVIRETKFRKSRLVPIDASTRDALARYLDKRRLIATVDDHLFVSSRRGPLKRGSVNRTFPPLLEAAGIAPKCGVRRPRLMDFRHAFASNALRSCRPKNRGQADQNMLALMTYLGHAHPSSTYWYLECSPELMNDIAKSCERLIVEVTK